MVCTLSSLLRGIKVFLGWYQQKATDIRSRRWYKTRPTSRQFVSSALFGILCQTGRRLRAEAALETAETYGPLD